MTQDQPEPTTPGSDPVERPVPPRSGGGRPTPGRPYRTPRYTVFLITGAVVGLAVGVGLALWGGGEAAATEPGVLGYFSAFGVILGALLGGTCAVLVESLADRRARGRRRG